jgi:hypothetical protein
MTDPALIDVMERASSWPAEDRAKLIAAARLIEAQHGAGIELTDADWRMIESRVQAAERGEIAPEEEVEAFFRNYRRT